MLFRKDTGADFLVVGLGNPESRYDNTRHNVGFAATDYIRSKTGTKTDKAKFRALYGVWKYNGNRVFLMKPQTYMNLSGDAVWLCAQYYKIPPENIIVISDDVSLAVGKMRIRRKGSRGGHNGLKSIIGHIGDNFPRIKIGVGEKPSPDYDLADWVLGKFTDRETKVLKEEYESVFSAVKLIIDGQTDKAMNLYN